jgi:hypothetical protein
MAPTSLAVAEGFNGGRAFPSEAWTIEAELLVNASQRTATDRRTRSRPGSVAPQIPYIRFLMNGAEQTQQPWELASGKSLTELFEVVSRSTKGGCRWQRFRCELTEPDRLVAGAWLVAAEIMGLRCNQATHLFRLWESAARNEPLPDGADLSVLVPFVEPSFGLPPEGIAVDHTQGYVAEVVWRMLAKEQDSPNRTLVYLARPDPDVHGPGADGFAIYKRGDDFIYRLWEIKKREGSGAVSQTISKAYSQLVENAERYLAKLTATSDVSDGNLTTTFAELVPNWKSAHPSAGAGVAVAANAAALPNTAFSTMHKRFPALAPNDCLEGCLVGVGDFAEFSLDVRRLLWSGLSITMP